MRHKPQIAHEHEDGGSAGTGTGDLVIDAAPDDTIVGDEHQGVAARQDTMPARAPVCAVAELFAGADDRYAGVIRAEPAERTVVLAGLVSGDRCSEVDFTRAAV